MHNLCALQNRENGYFAESMARVTLMTEWEVQPFIQTINSFFTDSNPTQRGGKNEN